MVGYISIRLMVNVRSCGMVQAWQVLDQLDQQPTLSFCKIMPNVYVLFILFGRMLNAHVNLYSVHVCICLCMLAYQTVLPLINIAAVQLAVAAAGRLQFISCL